MDIDFLQVLTKKRQCIMMDCWFFDKH